MIKIPAYFLSLLTVLLLAGCAALPWPDSAATSEAYQVKYSVPPPKASTKAFYTIKEPLQCVPYAREISGIPIRGNAHTWWGQANGQYKRSAVPRVGAVMVLSKTSRLKYGHLAVVKKIIDSRNIEVAHSNWGGDRKTRSFVYNHMPVVDTSPNNNWSSARFWNYPSSSYGSIYTVSGFIYPNVNSTPSAVSLLAPEQKPPVVPTPRLKPIY